MLTAINPQVGPDARVMGGITLNNVVLPSVGGLRGAAPMSAAQRAAGQATFATPFIGAALDDYRWAYLPGAYPTLVEAYEQLGQPDEAAKWLRKDEFLNGR